MVRKTRGGGRRFVATAIALSPEQVKRLDLLAASERRSRSFIVRDAVNRELERHERARLRGD
jgi:predicted transcriptional regulator